MVEKSSYPKVDVSVCMATYNGEKFIRHQVESILDEFGQDDELIIVDDSSIDGTTQILRSFGDRRLRLFVNDKNLGVNAAFEKAIQLAGNEIIFLSDQDDVWVSGRLGVMKDALLNSGKMLLTSNAICINTWGEKMELSLGAVSDSSSETYLRNILDIFLGKGNYFGCVMAFRSNLKKVILPFPDYIESHDLWIAKAANLLKSNLHLNEVTLFRRVHGANASIIRRNLLSKIWSRFIFVRSIIELKRRIHYTKL